MRRVARLEPGDDVTQGIEERLLREREALAAHFGVPLAGCEPPQFLRYREGDFFVAHQDGGTGVLQLDAAQQRKISVVVFLDSQGEAYGGGALRFTEWRPGRARGDYTHNGRAGSLLAFRAETTHEVTPVEWGERFSIASWYF